MIENTTNQSVFTFGSQGPEASTFASYNARNVASVSTETYMPQYKGEGMDVDSDEMNWTQLFKDSNAVAKAVKAAKAAATKETAFSQYRSSPPSAPIEDTNPPAAKMRCVETKPSNTGPSRQSKIPVPVRELIHNLGKFNMDTAPRKAAKSSEPVVKPSTPKKASYASQAGQLPTRLFKQPVRNVAKHLSSFNSTGSTGSNESMDSSDSSNLSQNSFSVVFRSTVRKDAMLPPPKKAVGAYDVAGAQKKLDAAKAKAEDLKKQTAFGTRSDKSSQNRKPLRNRTFAELYWLNGSNTRVIYK